MEEIYSSFADLLERTCTVNGAQALVKGIRSSMPDRVRLGNDELEVLLRLAQSVNKRILRISKTGRSVNGDIQVSELDRAVVSLIEDHVSASDAQISRAIEELLRRTDLFSSIHAPAGSLDSMIDSVMTPTSTEASAIYVPRQPRLPGLPIPPPDQFGDWDEYRDDLDPGYRVRESYELDLMREGDACSQSTCVTKLVNEATIDDEIFMSATPCEPSPVPMAASICDDNDELCRASSFGQPETVHTPSLTGDLVSSRIHARPTSDSPSFGASDPAAADHHTNSLTYQYDFMGGVSEVPRKAAAARRLPREISLAVPDELTLSPYPATLENNRVIDSINLPVVYESGRTGFEPSKEFDSSNGTLVAGRYRISGYLGAAAFSKAVRAVDEWSDDKRQVCLKIIKNDKDFIDQSLDEIKVLSLLHRAGADQTSNCLSMLNAVYWKEHLIIVTELLLDNLYEFSKFNRNPANAQAPYFTLGRLQRITKQILTALVTFHDMGLIHCDLKPENILFKSYTACQVKVIDFGSSCFETDRLSSYVQSRCYRAPEIILGCLPYNSAVDMWSLGCILSELWTGFVLFQNDSSQSLLARILGIIGRFPQWMLAEGKNVSHFFLNNSLFVELDTAGVVSGKGRLLQVLVPKRTSLFQRMRVEDQEFLEFLSSLLQIDPHLRITARDALAHSWLTAGKYPDGL